MSKYQPRIILNDPEKNVPDSIVDQFFLTIKSGDIDKIRDFAIQYKNKYNLIEKTAKGSLTESGKTPFHIVLELDSKVADNNQKLRIMNFLNQMGAPMELPDSADVWPIHLAASLQSDKIIDFFIKNHVSVNRRDSSNNTPLHYAIMGREIDCPKIMSVGSLAPAPKIDKMPLNVSISKMDDILVKILSGQVVVAKNIINDNLIHIINTIMKIPLMHEQTTIANELEAEITSIFIDVAATPTYSGDLTEQQNKLEQLIDRYYVTLNESILRGLVNPMIIAPNKGGWGPKIPDPNSNSGRRNPNAQERIMENERLNIRREITNDYATMKNKISSIDTLDIDKKIRKSIKNINNTISYSYIAKLIFCPECTNNPHYGEKVTLIKMMYLLIWNDYQLNHKNNVIYPNFPQNYPTDFANNVMDNFQLMNNNLHNQIIETTYKANFNWATDSLDNIFKGSLGHITEKIAAGPNANPQDILLNGIAQKKPPLLGSQCISNRLYRMFSNSDVQFADYKPEDNLAIPTSLFRQPLKNIVGALPITINASYTTTSKTWFDSLNELINKIQPIPSMPAPPKPLIANIFFDLSDGKYKIPKTPLPKPAGATIQSPLGSLDYYTYHELFRIMQMLEKSITTGSYEPTEYPKIFANNISDWGKYIDGLAAVATNSDFIDLYRILVAITQNAIRQAIIDCVEPIVRAANVFDDGHMYNMILPSNPNPTEFNALKSPTLLNIKLKSRWIKESSLMKTFRDKIKINIPPNVIDDVVQLMLDPSNINNFNYDSFHLVRQIIEQEVVNNDAVKFFANDPTYRNFIRTYLGTNQNLQPGQQPIKFDANRPLAGYFKNNPKVPQYIGLIHEFNFIDKYDVNFSNFRSDPELINQSFFLTETYGYFFAMILKSLYHVGKNIEIIRNIILDIITFINNKTIYYIPQIFLPALIKQIVVCVESLLKIRDHIILFQTRKNEFDPLIDVQKDLEAKSIMDLGQQLIDFVTKQVDLIYPDLMTIVDYHNQVIEFLNYHSAYQLVTNTKTVNQQSSTPGLFNMNLIPIDVFPNIFTQSRNYQALLKNLRAYRIPDIFYYADGDEQARLRFETFYDDSVTDPITARYRNIIDYARSSKIVPDLLVLPLYARNVQINIAIDTSTYPSTYTISDVNIPIRGQWLNFDVTNKDRFITNPENATYFDAFIAYQSKPYEFNWLNGMAPSIRNLAGKHLTSLKQRIIEETIQLFVDNQAKKDTDNTKNMDMVKLYNDIKTLGQDTTTYDIASDIKVYVIIGKMVDALLNKMFEYTIRQSISDWIYRFTTTNSSFAPLTDNIAQTVNLIRQKNYLKLSLQDMDRDAIDDLLLTNPKYIDYKLSQIEQNPGNLQYATKPSATEFVHYLFDINYFPTGDSITGSSKNKTCYYINTNTVPKFINSDTLNAKNSDGNTPLHMAVTLAYPELVELLISKGATSRAFTNNYGKTPYDIGLSNAEIQLNYGNGTTVSDSINYFVIPFNDLMVSRLLEDKYKNNIVKNITLGIPIQLIMYNHMFHLYLENYRYGFTIELKQAIIKLLNKYFGLTVNNVYPMDLFAISNRQQIIKITNPETAENRVAATISAANQRKISLNEERLAQLEIQLDGLTREWATTTDPEQLKMLNRLKKLIADLKSKQLALKPNNPVVDDSMVVAFESRIKSINQRTVDRNMSLVDFYNTLFGRLGRSKEMYLAIWNNYLQKELLLSAPSMIFPLLNKILIQIIDTSRTNKLDADVKNDLTQIVNFYTVVAKYIESRQTYPEKLTDNPVIQEDVNQLIYLINLILTPAMLNILLSQIYLSMREMDPTNAITGDETATLDAISAAKFNGQTIETFLTDVLPKQAVKYYTRIYNDDYDPDRKITSANDLFGPIIQIIKNNRTIQITDNSLLVENLNDYLIPFMANTYQTFIHHVRLTVYGYERYLLNVYQLSRILQSLV